MKLTVWGAAEQVTGSMHLLETNGFRILIDCGLNYEGGVDLAENENFPFAPADIDLVVLTHAHIDHSGNIPTLIKNGFGGQILCTHPTADLTQLLLSDSVNIFLRKQQDKKRSRGKFKKNRFVNNKQPLYLQKHVNDTADRTVAIAINKPFKINQNITLRLIPTGHLLGAAAAHFTINENGVEKTIAFTGDIGRKNYPVLTDPAFLPETNYLICESTYGGRFHSTTATLQQTLINVITEACIAQPGRLIIPAFSVGRTQSLVFSLNNIFSSGLLPPIPVFVDSPMASMATEIYRKHHQYVSDEAKSFYKQYGNEYDFENLSYVKALKQSNEIANHFEPCIIISSAGMLEGGRIQDHIFKNIENYYATLFFIGYCAKGTLGNRLLRGDSFVNIKGKELTVMATIKKTDLLSGHGDHADIMEYISKIPNHSLKRVFLVHGEPESMEALKVNLELNKLEVTIPKKGVSFEL